MIGEIGIHIANPIEYFSEMMDSLHKQELQIQNFVPQINSPIVSPSLLERYNSISQTHDP
jgi:hypothetical protein